MASTAAEVLCIGWWQKSRLLEIILRTMLPNIGPMRKIQICETQKANFLEKIWERGASITIPMAEYSHPLISLETCS